MNLFLKKGIIFLILISSIYACSTNDYLTDSGVSKAETNLTAYDYLKNHKYKMFDSLITLIDHYNLKDTINNSGTFFAPNDNNIRQFLKIKQDSLRKVKTDTSTYTFKDLLKDKTYTSHSILQYAFKDKITLGSATTSDKAYTSLKNDLIIVKKIQTKDNAYYQYSTDPVYFLYYCKGQKENEVCQTTDILTQNGSGTVLHVLNNTHIYNLFTKKKVN